MQTAGSTFSAGLLFEVSRGLIICEWACAVPDLYVWEILQSEVSLTIYDVCLKIS